jgi:glycosyltransferase involved in cell wall biosynthesis
MKAVLIMPALNEAGVVASLVRRVPREAVAEVIVVDNGSTDGTAIVAREAGARVVNEPRRGYGAACHAGVSALPPDAGIAVFMDADGSQRPEEIPLVLAPVLGGRADLTLGARHLEGGHPLHAALGTRLVARFVSWRWGVPITDFGPLRAIRADLLARLGMRDRASGWPVEMVVKAAVLGARIAEVPVLHGPRLAGRSKVSGTFRGTVRAAYGFLAAALRGTCPTRAVTPVAPSGPVPAELLEQSRRCASTASDDSV